MTPYTEEEMQGKRFSCKVKIEVGPYRRWIAVETSTEHPANGLFEQINKQIAKGNFVDCEAPTLIKEIL